MTHRVIDLTDRLGPQSTEITQETHDELGAPSLPAAVEALLLIADEPTGNLDSTTSVQIMALFQELYEQGKTVILVTHETDIAAYAKARIVLKDGKMLSVTESDA